MNCPRKVNNFLSLVFVFYDYYFNKKRKTKNVVKLDVKIQGYCATNSKTVKSA